MVNFGSLYFEVAMTEFPHFSSGIITKLVSHYIQMEGRYFIGGNKLHLNPRTVSIFRQCTLFAPEYMGNKVVIFC